MRTRRIVVVLAALLAAGAAVLLVSEGIQLVASTRGLGDAPGRADGSPGHEAIIVLGFGNTADRANRINRYRVRAALRSMDPRAASTALVLCGGSVMGDEPEARILARYARELGYRGPIVLEEASRSTRENVANAIPLVEDADTIRIVSDPVHAEEARGYLRAARPGLAARLARADDYRFGEMTWMKPLAIAVAVLRRARSRQVSPALQLSRSRTSPPVRCAPVSPAPSGDAPGPLASAGMNTLHPLLVMDYAFSYLGGAQTAVVQQALALARAGHAVTVAAPDASSVRELQGTGVTFHDVAPSFPISFLGLPLIRADAATRRDLAALMDAAGTDLVLTHSEHGLAATALRLGRERGIPTLHTVHTFFLRGPAWGGILAPMVTATHRAMTGLPDPKVHLAPRRLDSALRGTTLAACIEADLVLSPSAHQAVALRQAGLPAVEVLSNTSCAARGEPAPFPTGEQLRLVWAARFAPEKRLDVMLRAMALVAERSAPGAVHLDLAGGEPRTTAPPGVTVHGRVPTATVTALLRGAHAAVITSLGFDNQPMIAMEAFAEGRAAIVSDPVLAAEFDGAALLADGTDAEGLAESILRLAADRRPLDAAARVAEGLAASVAPEAHARSIEEACARVIRARRGSATA